MSNGYYSPAYGGSGSMSVNGQLVNVPMSSSFFPSAAAAPYYKGSGQSPPTIPLSYSSGNGSTSTQAAMAAANPFSFTQSPLMIAVIALVVGVLGLRYVHWRH